MASSHHIAERQVLLYFSADWVAWHHRILPVRVAQARWLVATPSLDIEVTDLDSAEDLRQSAGRRSCRTLVDPSSRSTSSRRSRSASSGRRRFGSQTC